MKQIIITILLTVFFCQFANAQDNQSVDCVRAEPKPILKKQIYPKKTFSRVKSKSNSGESIGYEKIKLNKDVLLTVINSGCENYTLTFQFTISGFSRKLDETKFWFNKAVELMKNVKKGIGAADINLINRGTNALSSYIRKTRVPHFSTEIDFGGKEIRDVVFVNQVKKQGTKKYQLEIIYTVGPL